MSRLSRFLPLLVTTLTVAAGTTWFLSERPVQAQQPAPAKKEYVLPAPGTVRVIAQKVRNDSEQVEWHWKIVTERYWSGIATDSQGSIELSGGEPTLRSDKPIIYYHRITVRSGKDSEGAPRMYTTSDTRQPFGEYHSQNQLAVARTGAGGSGGGSEPLQKTVAADKAARVLFTGDKTLTLPVKLPLYERTYGLDGTGKVKRHVYYLTLAK